MCCHVGEDTCNVPMYVWGVIGYRSLPRYITGPKTCSPLRDVPTWLCPMVTQMSHVPASPHYVMPRPVPQPMPLCAPMSYPRSQMSSTTLCSMGTGSRQRWAALAATSSSSPWTTRSSAAKRQR